MSFTMCLCSLFPELCPEETVHTARGTFEWPATGHSMEASLPCPRTPGQVATRRCLLMEEDRRAVWETPAVSHCGVVRLRQNTGREATEVTWSSRPHSETM